MLICSQGEATCPNTHTLKPVKVSNNWPCLLCGDLRKGNCWMWTCKHHFPDGSATCEYQVCDACFHKTVIFHGFIFSSISRFTEGHTEPPDWKAEGTPTKRNKLSKHLTSQVRIFIGPESDHWLCLSLTDSLPNSCLVNLMPVNDAAWAVYNWQRPSNLHQLALLHIYLAGRVNFWNKSSNVLIRYYLISLPLPITNFPLFWESQYCTFSCFPPLPRWPHLRNEIVKVGN